MPRATINDVAASAGVSTATVSRVLNGHSVASATADRVWKAVAELDYTPNALTRGVFAGRSSTIGVIIRDLNSPYYLELMRGIDEAAAAHGSLVMFANTFSQVEREAGHVQTMDEQRVRGLILTTGPTTDERTRRMAAAGTPCVIVARTVADPPPNLHSISLDNIEAGQLIGGHLVSCGRSSIGVITVGRRQSAMDRVDGLRGVLKEHELQLPDNLVRVLGIGAPIHTAVATAVEDMLAAARAHGRGIDAVVCTSGLLTRHAYEALRERGLRIPDDIALIAMDDFDWADVLGITVVAQPSYEMGKEAATLIATRPAEPVQIVKKPRLIMRRSCGEE